jgi:NAD(P)-dependent dehydrogenase (short-subunit alcohol dehydrogenase family)
MRDVKKESEMEDISFDFTNQVVIITGAARGVGRALVGAFVAARARVAVADRDAQGLRETCDLYPGVVLPVAMDVCDVNAVQSLVDAAVREWGRLDVCINNAAVAPHTALLEETPAVWDRVYAVNVRGTFLMTQASAKAMIAAGHGGRIINFSSTASVHGGPGAAAYASSRAAVESFSRVAAVELAPHGIRVNTIRPGLIDTQPKPLPEHMAAQLKARIPTLPMARPGEANEVVRVAMFLASQASSYMTGSVVVVDGGSSIGSRFSGEVVDDDSRYFWLRP